LASQYGRYGYRRITALLQRAGWQVGKDRVERIWRREGLKVPQKQKPRGRLWLNDESCVRLRPERRNHVWGYDFVSAKTHDGRTARMLNLIDEHTRECLPYRKIKITESEDDPCDPPREGEFAEGGICHLPPLLLSEAYRSAFGERS
jgi:transposase InsO family protein